VILWIPEEPNITFMRDDVINHFRWGNLIFLLALMAEGMLIQIALAILAPSLVVIEIVPLI